MLIRVIDWMSKVVVIELFHKSFTIASYIAQLMINIKLPIYFIRLVTFKVKR